MPDQADKRVAWLFGGLCVLTLAGLIYFAESIATHSAPAYSTWNAGADGAKLLFDSLKQSGLVNVERQFESVTLHTPKQSTIFFLGMESFALKYEDEEFFRSTEAAAKQGNVLVFAVLDDYFFDGQSKVVDSHSPQPPKTEIQKQWGVSIDKGGFHPDKNWRNAFGLTNVWQRAFGSGTIILLTKGGRLNNKNIATDSAARQLLYQLISQRPSVVFEEAHLGIRESGSIMGLARRYHLQGLILGFLLLAALFVWSRSVSFPPPRPEEKKPLLGSDNQSMLAELMARHLKNQLISICVQEWNRTRGHKNVLAPPIDPNPVSAYREIQESLQDKSIFKI